MFCKNCGYDLPDSVKFCPRCGTKILPPGSAAGAAPQESPSPQEGADVIKKKGSSKPPKKYMLAGAVSLLLVLCIVLVFVVRKKDLRSRLEEQLRLGAAYLQEMNFDMALDAYAAAIEIDEREPRAYLGRADVYTVMARETARQAQSEDDIRKARDYKGNAEKDIEKVEELLDPEMGEDETDSYLENARKNLDDAGDMIDLRYVEVADLQKVIESVLSLPYIGNTSYGESFSGGGAEPFALREGSGYISAAVSDLDGDDFPEVLVISLEGEDSLGRGQNRLLLHVLEYEDETWREAARQDMEEYTSVSVNDYAIPLIRDVFLRSQEDAVSIFVESRYIGEARITWSLHRYVYDGMAFVLQPVCESVPADTELSAHGNLFFNNPAYSGVEEYQHIWSVLGDMEESGLPVMEGGQFTPRLILSDAEGITALASFYRDHGEEGPASGQSLVDLTDWFLLPEEEAEARKEEAAEEEEASTQEDLTWEAQEALYKSSFADIQTRMRNTWGGNSRCDFCYYDMDKDGIFELFVNYTDYSNYWGTALYTIQGGWVTELALDYRPGRGERLYLGAAADGRPLLSSYANMRERGYEPYFDFTFYALTKKDLTVTREKIDSYSGYYDDISVPDCLTFFSADTPRGINFCDLMYRLRSRTKYDYELYNWTVRGNTVSGMLFRSQGEGAIEGGSFELHLDTASAVLYYNAFMEEYYATERLTLR
ncbi:MAG: zinc-ribbon domain-containing protein [bacterium]